jgi:pantetheine-phosphate adenylyltransferase
VTRSAIYPGTFDPITNGHVDLIQRGCSLFDHLVVAVARKPQKSPLFSAEDRLAMAQKATRGTAGVEVVIFDNLLIEFAATQGCQAIIRGLRAVSDFEYELQIALTNRKLNPDIETVFLAPSEPYIYLSSSIVKEIASYSGPVEGFVPAPVAEHLREKFPGLRERE